MHTGAYVLMKHKLSQQHQLPQNITLPTWCYFILCGTDYGNSIYTFNIQFIAPKAKTQGNTSGHLLNYQTM